MIKYNLKKILLEEDDIDIVDTSFMDKWDEVPATNLAQWEYQDDLKKHIKGRLTDYVKNNPDVTLEYLKHFLIPRYMGSPTTFPSSMSQAEHGNQMVRHYVNNWEEHMENVWDADEYHDNHIENSRADTWIKDFHTWLENLNPQGYTLRLDKVIDED